MSWTLVLIVGWKAGSATPRKAGFQGAVVGARMPPLVCWRAPRVCLVCSHSPPPVHFTFYSMHEIEDKVSFRGEQMARARGGGGGAGAGVSGLRPRKHSVNPQRPHTFPPPQTATEDAPVAEEVMIKDVVVEEVRIEGWKEGGRVAAAGLGSRALARARAQAREKKSRQKKL